MLLWSYCFLHSDAHTSKYSDLKFIIVKTGYRHWTATGHYWKIKNKTTKFIILYVFLSSSFILLLLFHLREMYAFCKVHTYVGPRSVQNAIKMDERNENVIDGIIKMYLKMHHIDFWNIYCTHKKNVCLDSFENYLLCLLCKMC